MRGWIAAAALLLAGCGAEARTLDEALNAYNQNKVAEAETALRRIANDPAASPGHRAQAHRELARIAWLIDGRPDAALQALDQADSTGEEACDNALVRARIMQESTLDARLLAEADILAQRCQQPDRAGLIRLDASEAALDLAAADLTDRADFLSQARTRLDQLDDDLRRSLEGAAAGLRLALLEGDAAGAVQAWKDYFWLSQTDMPPAMRGTYPAARPVFEAGLASAAPAQDRLRLVDLLVRAGFADAAERFALAAGLPAAAAGHPLWRKATGYFEARRELEAVILASNRSVARGGRAADLEAAFANMADRLIGAAGLTGDREEGLKRAYGLHGRTGDTDGYASVHLGHIVQDERREVEQYGHRASIAFLAIDNMIANGFNSWLWDGRAATGGWAAPGPVVVQVRSGYTSNPLSAFRLFAGGAQRDRLLARQAERAARDLAIIGEREVGYLPGLADRIQLQVADQVGARVRAAEAPNADLRRAFLAEYWRATFHQFMLIHEGRHALDRVLVRGIARLSDSNLEYRAKLSELALADYPRLAFLNINDLTVGDSSGHGQANERLLREYAAWIAAHSSEIAGFDPGQPAIVQIDKLTDDQIRAIARSLDPIARP